MSRHPHPASGSGRSADTQPREIEFKFAVDDGRAFERLIEHLGMPADLLDGGINQVNHFFDTATRALRANGIVVRLREQNGAYRLTLKKSAPAISATAALTDRIEYETPVAPAVAREFLDHQALPLDGLQKAFDPQSQAVARLLEACGADQDLRYIGHFKNKRVPIPVSLTVNGRLHELVMEFDTSEFPGLPPAREIEVEIPTHDNAQTLQRALIQLLDTAGVRWRTTSNKAARFFAALSAQNHGLMNDPD